MVATDSIKPGDCFFNMARKKIGRPSVYPPIAIGDTIHNWTITAAAGGPSGDPFWICFCRLCGTERRVRGISIRSGVSVSCGCVKSATHGMSKSTEYQIWRGMLGRCYLKCSPSYRNYGGRGITVCDRWRNSFEAFIEDVGDRPSPVHQLDRWPDNDGNYEPGNVRWATKIQNCRNTRINLWLTIGGVTKTLAEWSEVSGLDNATITGRIRRGWANSSLLLPCATPHRIRCGICGKLYFNVGAALLCCSGDRPNA